MADTDFEPDFDAIVVGGGIAGCIAALELARAEKSVLVVERGNYSGAKNMTGGRIYSHSLHKVFPDNFDEIPFERKVTRERISLMAPESNFTIEYTSPELYKDGQESYTVLRAPFDQWLAEQAEDAGAEFINGIAVEELIKNDAGKIIGIKAGDDEITASVVLLCDGVNSLLTRQAVGFQRPKATDMAVGIKDVFELPEDEITSRFNCNPGEGVAWLFAGDVTHGLFGGGIIYVNRESLSVGIVAGIDAIANNAKRPIYQMLQDFEDRDDIKPLLAGATRAEHSGHMVPEGGLNMMPELTTDGCLIVGDAAMMCINFGYTVRGMDYAVEAGRIAGQQAAKAIDAGDTSKAGLAGYVNELENSFVMKDLRGFQNEPQFMEHFDHMFKGYPEMVGNIMDKMFTVNGPAGHVKPMVMPEVKKMGYMSLFKDVRGAMKAL